MVGSGPREFFSPQLQNVTGSTIEICDIQLRRTTRYGTDGELLGVTTAPATFTEPFNQLYTSSNGNYVAVRVQNANTEYVYTEFWVVGSDGSVLATHRSPDVKSSIMMDMGGSRPSPYQYPYPPMPAAVYVSEEAFAVSGGVDPVIDIFGLDGDVKRRIRVEDLPLGITAADRERFESFWAERIETYPQAARPLAVQNRSELRKAMPDGKPPWTFISVDDRGYWWLRVQDKPDVWLSGLQSYTYCPESEIR